MILKILLALLCAFAMVIPTKHALHMFQQNRYEIGRYTSWIKDSMHTERQSILVPAAVFALGFVTGILKGNAQLIVLCVLVAVCGCVQFMREKNKSYIKPLVYTARVKRQHLKSFLIKYKAAFPLLQQVRIYTAKTENRCGQHLAQIWDRII